MTVQDAKMIKAALVHSNLDNQACVDVLTALDELRKDAERLEWYFSPDSLEDRYFVDAYCQGVKERWTVDQWRAAIDAAMKGDTK